MAIDKNFLAAANEADSIQLRSGTVTFTGEPRTIIPEPAVVELRRQKLRKMAKQP